MLRMIRGELGKPGKVVVTRSEPDVDPEGAVADLLQAAITTDAVATRAFGEIFACLALPDEVFSRPGVLDHILSLAGSVTPTPIPGPDRAQLLELVSA